MKKHWYKFTVFGCPVCGSKTVYRTRKYTKRPEDYGERHEWIDTYDYCNA